MKKYFKHKINNLLVINSIITVHYFELDKNFSTNGEKHDFWEIVYAIKEDIICEIDKKPITLKQNQMIFHKPNEFHSHKANKHRSPNVFIISFETKSSAIKFFENKIITLNKVYEKYINHIINESKKTFDIPYADPSLKKLNLLNSPTLGGEQLIKNYLEILLINIMRDLTESNQENKVFIQDKDLSNNLVKDVISIFNDNLYTQLKIDEIVNKTNFSRTHIFKEFKKATGKSPIEYFNFLKIEKSKELLRDGSYTISEISEKLNFDTPNYFSKTFKKYVGVTPTEYIKRLPK